MNRGPHRRSSAIQKESLTPNPSPKAGEGGKNSLTPNPSPRAGEGGDTDEPKPDQAGRLPLGWRVAILVWACGFAGLFGYELWNLLWKLGKSMFGGE